MIQKHGAAVRIFTSLLIEFGPIVVFLVASEITDFFRAATAFIFSTIAAMVGSYLERGSIARFPLLVGVVIISTGTLTVVLDNPFYLIFKDTIYNGVFAIVLFAGLARGKGLLKLFFNGLFSMTDRGWRILSMRWAIMFTVLTVTNEFARITLTPNEWVMFKAFATLTTMIFALYQFRLSKQERLPDATEWGMRA